MKNMKKKSKKKKSQPEVTEGPIRLQKILSQAGICSRRKAEELILSGRVSVNGKVVTVLGTKADPQKDEVRVDGALIGPAEERVYIALHKPAGVLSSREDDKGRQVVTDLIDGITERLYPVGRLDYHSEGLILLTNDGEFANKITHPRYEIPKVYRVKVKGRPVPSDIAKLMRGIKAGKERLKAFRIEEDEKLAKNTWYKVELHEGKNREIRRMFEAIGHDVIRLIRLRVGPVSLGDLKAGEWRYLKPREVTALLSMADKGSPSQSEGNRRKIVKNIR